MEPINIIGLTPGSLTLTPFATEALAKADLVVGGKRLLKACPDQLLSDSAVRLPIAGPLGPVIEAVRKAASSGRNVVVLADGDPLFFGIGKRLGEELGRENLRVEPTVSTMQLAAARLALPWQEMDFVSLHGRDDFAPLYASLVCADLIAVFTDEVNTPAEVARALLERGADCFSMTVLEDLGSPEERIRPLALPETWGMDFAQLNLVILERQYPARDRTDPRHSGPLLPAPEKSDHQAAGARRRTGPSQRGARLHGLGPRRRLRLGLHRGVPSGPARPRLCRGTETRPARP